MPKVTLGGGLPLASVPLSMYTEIKQVSTWMVDKFLCWTEKLQIGERGGLERSMQYWIRVGRHHCELRYSLVGVEMSDYRLACT